MLSRPWFRVVIGSHRGLVAAAAVCVVALVAVVGASADPSIREKRAQAEAIVAEIEQIDEEVGAAAERWNGATLELTRLEQQLSVTRRHLKVVRGSSAIAQARAPTSCGSSTWRESERRRWR